MIKNKKLINIGFYYAFALLLLWPSTGISLDLKFTKEQISQAKELAKEGKGTLKLTAEQTLQVQQMLEQFTPKFDIKQEIKTSLRNHYWVNVCICDTLLFFSTYLRHKVYGNNDVSDQVKNIIKPILDKASLASSTQIKQANSFFSWLISWPGSNVFSNHNSIFINKALCNKIQSNTLSLETKNKFIYELARTSALIKNNCDAKMLAAGIIIPPLVFFGAQLINKIAVKFAEGKQENSFAKKCAGCTKKLYQSFFGKAGIAFTLILMQAIYLDRKISTDTTKLLSDMGIEHSTHNGTWSLTSTLNLLFNRI